MGNHRKSSSYNQAGNLVSNTFDTPLNMQLFIQQKMGDSVVQLQQPMQLDADRIANYVERMNVVGVS